MTGKTRQLNRLRPADVKAASEIEQNFALPLQHFRRSVAQLAATPDLHSMVFAGTNITQQEIARPDFVLTPAILWQACDNIRAVMGAGWYLHFPQLWSLDVQGDFECAMRFAPNLATSLSVAERYGHVRWAIARWTVAHEKAFARISLSRTTQISPENWQMIGVIVGLNFQTILRTAFPGVASTVIAEVVGSAPVPDSKIAELFQCQVRWEAAVHSTLIEHHHFETPSALADSKAYAAMITALEADQLPGGASWKVRVANILGDLPYRRPGIAEVADRAGVSVRTLERALSEEGASFRKLLDDSLIARFETAAREPGIHLGLIAERLGYSDESALSRATRRWYGCSAAEARRRLQTG